MKTKIIFKGILISALGMMMAGCGDDYLQEKPLTDISAATVSSSEEGARAAVTGLLRQMQKTYSDLKNSNLNPNGEMFMAVQYGEGLSADANIGEITNYATGSCNPDNIRGGTSWWGAWMYRYCYSIIGSANTIIGDLPEGDLTDSQNWLMGCALTMRAHAYWRLMEVYGPRWADSNNGEAYALVMRLKSGEGNEHPLNTCNEIFDQMYNDLKKAIDCFDHTTIRRGDDMFYPDKSVAQGTLARMALLKNDFVTAQQMAHDARQGYPIMTPEQYIEGFSKKNPEWMWGPAMDPLGVGYYGFGNHHACNGHYVSETWGYTDSMDYGLYRLLKPTDIRATLYFGPLIVDLMPDMAAEFGITKEDFFSDKVYLATKLGISITSTGTPPSKAKNKAMLNFIQAYGNTFLDKRPKSITPIYSLNKKGMSLGLQYKFQGLDDGYTSCWPPYMRGAEMLLTEAEAAYHNNDLATAKACLQELMAKRDPNYSLPADAELLEEIYLQRRIELWGEGHNWFDYKRWNIPYARKEWNPNDRENSGGWPKTLVREFPTNWMNGWRVAIPEREFTYNKEANASLVGL
ncbi:MAG: RagB/SusD family nutrient uptake outer membrane protein [Muribaculaceae bacterium]|nr:RagB/SusD family nutrient uptake outer membrane protein [Muribaculaceae bacterium]